MPNDAAAFGGGGAGAQLLDDFVGGAELLVAAYDFDAGAAVSIHEDAGGT